MKRAALVVSGVLAGILATATIAFAQADDMGRGRGGNAAVNGGAISPVSLTLSQSTGNNAITLLNNGARIDMGTGSSDYLYSDGTLVYAHSSFQSDDTVFAINGFQSKTVGLSASSGANAVAVQTNGARIDVGAGASDYLSSDGTTVSTPAPFQAASYNLAGTAASAGCVGASGNDQICLSPNQMTISASGGLHIGSATPLLNDALIGTAGSGTGISTTIAGTAAIRPWVDKVTVINTALTAAGSTDVTIWTTLVNTKLIALTGDVTQVFTGGALSAMTVQCGNAAGGTQYLLPGSVFAAQTTLGDVNAEIGLNLIPGNAAYAPFGTPAAGIPGAIAISCRFTCTGANCNAATQGSITFEIEGVSYP